MPENPTVRPGQIWADNDRRSAGRPYLLVEHVEATHATAVECAYNNTTGIAVPLPSARRPRILLRRMRPTSTGYRLIREAPDA